MLLKTKPRKLIKMHCWLLARARVGGEDYLSLRLVNARKEFDKARSHAPIGRPFWHTPSVKFDFDPADGTPSAMEVAESAKGQIAKEWPALAHARIVGASQNRGRFGERDIKGVTEKATLIGLDLGRFEAEEMLPRVLLRPGQKLPFIRQPLRWKSSRIIHAVDMPDSRTLPVLATERGAEGYIVTGENRMRIKTDEGIRNRSFPDSPLQGTVAGAFTRLLGVRFGRAGQDPNPSAALPRASKANPVFSL